MKYSKRKLKKAREYAAGFNRRIAEKVFTADYYADHVTEYMKQAIHDREIAYAKEVESGLHDHNLTIQQRMHFYLTGESVALMSK